MAAFLVLVALVAIAIAAFVGSLQFHPHAPYPKLSAFVSCWALVISSGSLALYMAFDQWTTTLSLL